MAATMSGDTATLTTSGWLLHVLRATTAWAVSAAMTAAEIPTAIAVSSGTLTLRSLPRRLTRPRRSRGFTGILGSCGNEAPVPSPDKAVPQTRDSIGLPATDQAN